MTRHPVSVDYTLSTNINLQTNKSTSCLQLKHALWKHVDEPISDRCQSPCSTSYIFFYNNWFLGLFTYIKASIKPSFFPLIFPFSWRPMYSFCKITSWMILFSYSACTYLVYGCMYMLYYMYISPIFHWWWRCYTDIEGKCKLMSVSVELKYFHPFRYIYNRIYNVGLVRCFRGALHIYTFTNIEKIEKVLIRRF